MTTETLEVRFAPATDASGTFKGIANAYGVLDSHGTEFAPGAFAVSVAERRADGGKVPLLLHHDPTRVAGVIEEIADTPEGLMVEGRFVTETEAGREAYALAKAGAFGLSVGFRRVSDRPRPGGGRIITEARLLEVSAVAIPSNSKSRMTEVRADPAASGAAPKTEKTMEDETKPDAPAKPDAEIRSETHDLGKTVADLAAEVRSLRDNNARMETVLRRPGVAPEARGEETPVEVRAFETFVRRGREALSADEIRTLRVSDDTQGGYLAPDAFIGEILRDVVQFSPVRQVARVGTIGTGAAILPKRTGGMTAQWVGETDTRPETTVTFGQNRYEVRELSAYVDVSNASLEDSAFNIASELAFELSEEFGRAEGAAFVNGDGKLRPFGFMADPNIASTNSGSASAITADGLIDLYHALKRPYRANAVWMMNATTLGAVRKLKTTGGEYLLSMAGLNGAPGTTLLGRPVVEAEDMPDISGGAFPVAFGDFGMGYRVFDRVQLSVLRDPYTQAVNGMTRFHARRRVAGGVAKSEALRKLKIAS